MADILKGKVAAILSDRELVMNIGSTKGVAEGMLFDVLDAKGTDIRDPDTQTVLGSVNRPKVRVKVTSVQENLAVAATYKRTKINEGGTGPDLSEQFSFSSRLLPQKWVTKVQTFRAEEALWKDIDERESIVKVGDPVMHVTESEID